MEEQIISISMLSFLAIREEYDPIGCVESDIEKGFWEKITNEIIEVLKKYNFVLGLLREDSVFFNILSYDETCNYYVERAKDGSDVQRRITFVDIFSPEYAYAIVQERVDELQPWKQYLIQFPAKNDEVESKNVLDDIYELKTIRTEKRRKECEYEIEQWGNMMLKNAKNFKERIMIKSSSKQQFITKWILKNIPTIGMFADEEGNVRINILSNKLLPYVYLDQNVKGLVAKRLLEKSQEDGIERFSTFAWQNNYYLGCKVIPYKMYYVKRGYISDFTLKRVILPLGGMEFRAISLALQDDRKMCVVSQILRLYEKVNIKNYIQKIKKNYSERNFAGLLSEEEIELCKILEKHKVTLRTLEAGYFEMILATIKRKTQGWSKREWEKLYLSETEILNGNEEIWKKIFREITINNCKLQENEENNLTYLTNMKKIADGENFWNLCKVWVYIAYRYLNIANEDSQIEKIRDAYFGNLENDEEFREKQERIYRYVKNHGCYDMTLDNISKCYLQFADELFQLYKELETVNSMKSIEKILNSGLATSLRRVGEVFYN